MARQQAFLESVFRNNRNFPKQNQSSRKKPQRKLAFEALEPRVLLSNDTMVFAADALHNDLTLRIDDGVAKIIDSNTGSLLLSGALENTSAVAIQGSEGDDSLTIDSSVASAGIGVSFDGSTGTDALYGSGENSTWNVTGDGFGSVGNVTFADLEQLIGAADNEDTFILAQDASVELVDGGDRGFDSLKFEGTYNTVVSRATGPSSGTVLLDSMVVRYEGLEPTSLASAQHIVIDLDTGLNSPGGADIAELKHVAGQTYVLDSVNGTFEDTDFQDYGGTGSVTIKLGEGSDIITLIGLQDLGTPLIIQGEEGDDTYRFDDDWGNVSIEESASQGNDTLDFTQFNVASPTISIEPQLSGDIHINGSDSSQITIGSAHKTNFEDLTGANIDLTGTINSVKNELLGGLENIVEFGRNLAEAGAFLESLPIIGSNADVALSKALDFAEALDEIRFDIAEFFDGLPTLTTNQLIQRLNAKFNGAAETLEHLGAAILSAKAIAGTDIQSTDFYEFELDMDGTTVTLIVDVDASSMGGNPAPVLSNAGATVKLGIGPGPAYTLDQLLSAINLGLTTLNATSGSVIAAQRDGRFAFQAVGSEIDTFSVAGASTAISKLGFSGTAVVLDNVKDILRGLGTLNVSVGDAVTLDTSFEGGVPKLRFNLDYEASRTSKFLYDLGEQADTLGLAFDIDAQITATATFLLNMELGLSLSASGVDFFLDVNQLGAGISATVAAGTDINLNVGFLSATAEVEASLDAGIQVTGTIEGVADPSSINITAGMMIATGSDGTGVPDFNITLDVSVGAGLGTLTGSATISASGNPFNFASITLNTSGNFDADFGNFNNMTAGGIVALMGELSSWLDGIRESELIESLSIPFVEGALDKVLDIGEVVSDALLYDEGPDDVKDGLDRLVTDLNTALQRAGLGSQIRATGNGTSVSFIAIDPDVSGFSVALGTGDEAGPDGFEKLNVSGVAALVGGVLTLAGTPTQVTGRLDGKAVVKFSITRNSVLEVTDVTLEEADTADNLGIGDDAPKLLDANNSPTFKTAQELAGRLTQILTLGTVQYNTSTSVLTYAINFTDRPLFSFELPTDFEIDLSPIGNVESNTRLIIDAKGGIHLTLGFDLSDTPSGSTLLTNTTTLEDLEIEVKKEEAAVAQNAPRTTVGDLSGDATFTISYNPDGIVVVPKYLGEAGTDVNVTKINEDQSEATIAVNPVNPNNIIVAGNDLNSTNGLNANPAKDAIWFTKDGGTNWFRREIPVPAGGTGNAAGDPSLVFSRDGQMVVYTHMVEKTGGETVIAAAVSYDGGETWLQADTSVIGSFAVDEDNDGHDDGNDKNWIAVGPNVADLTQDLFVVTWQRHNVIYVATSVDGKVWNEATNGVPIVVGGLVQGSSTAEPRGFAIDSIPSIGPDGKIYVTWEEFGTTGVSHVMFDMSLDGGLTWGGGHDARVFFNTDQSELTDDDKAILDAVGAVMLADSTLIATIAGYTDTAGDPTANQTLSDDRADSVFDYLTTTLGISADRFTVLGFGEEHLAVQTADGVSEQANRRAEVTLDRVIYTGNLNVFRDEFGAVAGQGLDGVDETSSPAGLGEYEIPAQPNRGIWMGLSMDVDQSLGENRGRIYIAFADQGDLDGDPDENNATDHHDTDIFVIYSDDNGVTWTGPTRVNDDGGTASQFFSWIDVDPATGIVAISWYDTRNDAAGDDETEYFAAISRDSGVTWDANILVSDGVSNPSGANEYGDYTGLSIVNSTIYMSWADNSNSVAGNPDITVPITTELYFDKIRLTNSSISDLLFDINTAIDAVPVLAGKFEAQADGNTIKIVAIDPAIASFTVTTNTADPAFRDLGIQESATSTVVNGSPTIKAGKPAPTTVGQLTADAVFSIDLGSGAQQVTVSRLSTATNRNILDIVKDVQDAVDDAIGENLIDVSAAGTKLMFTRLGTPVAGNSDDFVITAGANAGELGITGVITSDEADLVITPNTGSPFRITLDAVTDIAGLLSAINSQSGGTITATITVDDPNGVATAINEAGTSLTLQSSGLATGNFMVATANGSKAGIQLGLIGVDANTQVDPSAVPDSKIIGGTIGGASLLDRFFIAAAPLGSLSDILDASLEVQAGLVVEDLIIMPGNVVTSTSFEFKEAHEGKVLTIKGVNGFTAGNYTINNVDEGTNHATLSASPGTAGRTGGVGLLKTGVQASATFGFVGIGLNGTANVGAELSLGFNTNAPEVVDGKLTLQELIDGLDHVLDLLAPPDLSPATGSDFGSVDLGVSLSAGGADFSGFAGALLGGSPGVTITLETLGDPFIDVRFTQANYHKVSATVFEVDGDFTGKLPVNAILSFDGDEAKITNRVYNGTTKTTVTIEATDANPSFVLPDDTELDGIGEDMDVNLLPKIDIQTNDLGGLPDFSNLSFADLLAILRALADFLGQFESFGFLNTDLPIIDKSVNDLLSFAEDFAEALDEAQNNPAGSLQILEQKLNEAVGITGARLAQIHNALGLGGSAPNDVFDLNYNKTTHLLTLDFSVGASFSEGLDVGIPGIDFGELLGEFADVLGSVLDLSGSAGLEASGNVLLRLSLGVDLTDFDPLADGFDLFDHLYLLESTGLDANIRVAGEDVAFRVGLGPFALSIAGTDIEDSFIELEGAVHAGLDNDAGDGDPSIFTGGKVSFNTVFDNLDTANFDLDLTGTIEGNFPVFFPNDSTQIGAIKIGGTDNAGNFVNQGDLINLIAGDGTFEIWTEGPEATPDAVVIDVTDIVEGIGNFNFDNFNIFDNIFLAIDGLDSILELVQNMIGGQIGGLTLPLVGDSLADGAHFIQDLRDDFIAPLRAGIEKAKDAAQDFSDPDKNIISKLIFDILGPDGIELLKKISGTGDSPGDFIELETNLDDYLFNPATTLELEDVFIQWGLKLGTVLVNESTDIGFDLGVPGLSLKTEGDITLDIEWELNLAFGLSFADGFYLVLDDPDTTDPEIELAFDISVGLPGAITGTLGFLGLRAEDTELEMDGSPRRTELGATFVVDIFQDGALNAEDKSKLGFTEFGDISFNAGIAASASAALAMELGLSADLLAEIFGPEAVNVVAGFPKLTGDFAFLFEIGSRATGETTLSGLVANSDFLALTGDANTADGGIFDGNGFENAMEEGLKLIEFRDIELDLGSFLSDVFGPIIEEVGKFTEPLQPLIDFVMSPVPIVGQLGLEITWLDLAASLGGFDPGMIEAIAEIITVINQIASVSDSEGVALPIGDMTVFDSISASPFTPALWDGGVDTEAVFDQLSNIGGLIENLIGDLGGIGAALDAVGEFAADILGDVVAEESAGGFKFPLFDNPTSIFGLLMGKDVDIVTYDLAPLQLEFEFRAFFSIFGPLGVSIGLLVEFMADTAFGYDTAGIREFVESGFQNPLLLFNGFFISDSPKLDGNDDPELVFTAELQAAAELNLGIARAGVAAALGFTIDFDLFDPNNDMKIRFNEILLNITNQLKAPSDAEKLLAPLAIFDVSGEIFARFFAFLQIDFGFFEIDEEFPIYGPVTLFDFEVDFFRPPALASEQDNGDLVIHTGEFAEQRLLGNAEDVAEYLIIESTGVSGNYVNVRIKAGDGALGDDADVFQEYKVLKGREIIIDGGEGNDKFDLNGFDDDGVIFDIDLGVGDDTILWNNSSADGVAGVFSTIVGGSGDDTIAGSGGSDLIFGGAGNDSITGNNGADLIFGDEGELKTDSVRGLVKPSDGGDTVTGGGGGDIIFGGGGKDDIAGGDQGDLLLGGGGVVFFNNATVQKVFANVKPLVTDPVRDVENAVFDKTAGDKLQGDGGNDVIYGTAGPDDIGGGSGNDVIFGGTGFDKIDGGSGNDTIFGDKGKIGPDTLNDVDTDPDNIPLAGGEADEIQGGTGNDIIYGGEGGDLIQGGDDDDVIYGGSGADKIFGDVGHVAAGILIADSGNGNDTLFGEGEADKIQGGAGIDFLDGGLGNDILRGGDDSDLLVTNKSSDDLDGQFGADTYMISFQGGNAVSLTRVNDSGESNAVDIFIATGTVFDDKILLRANTDGSVSFVAMINGPGAVERINYNFTVERIVINGSFGDDYFASDDTVAEVTINGEFGDDTFQVGQMFKSERGDTTDDDSDFFSDITGIAFNDVFATIETTRGFLSNGISAPMTINGGVGNDFFTVFHNKAVLQLNGEEGDDTFEIRAFALAGSQEPQRERTDISGGAGADLVQYAVNAPVNIDGGDGFDTVIIIGTEFGDDLVITDKGVFGAGLNVNFVNIESLRVDGAEGDDRFFVKSTSEKFLTEIFGGLGDDSFFMSGDTPPVISNDLKGHSGLILHDVESTDPRYDEQKIHSISANVADNEEPFAVIRQTQGSTIITEGGTYDSYEIVLTHEPTFDVLIFVLAPIPTPDSRERRALSFRVDSPTADEVTLDGSGLTLRFTSTDWWIPQEVRVYADNVTLTDTTTLFTRPELGDGTIPPGVDFQMDDEAYEGIRFGVVNHLIKTEAQLFTGLVVSANNGTPSVTINDLGISPTQLIGRRLFISEGPGAGETRFILGAVDDGLTYTLTLDRAFPEGNVPTNQSKYQIRIDDAIIGKMTSFDETPDGLPAVTTPEDKRSTFTDSSANFPTFGEGLTGAILEIIGGPGAGQQRLILGHVAGDANHTLILNGPWKIDPVANQSVYRIVRYESLAIPSVTVQVNDNDRPGLVIDETQGVVNAGAPAIELGDVVPDYDTITTVVEESNGDHLGEWDVIQVRLNKDPGGTVNVNLIYGSQLVVTNDAGETITQVSFNSGNWSTPKNLIVKGASDTLREGFHSSLIQFVVASGSNDTTDSTTDIFSPIAAYNAVYYVGLSFRPIASSVVVTLNGSVLTAADQDGLNGDYIVISNKVVFVDSTGDLKTVFGNLSVSYSYDVAGFITAFTNPVLTRINDDGDAPTVIVRESGGSTDVIEVRKSNSGDPDAIPVAFSTNESPWIDSYEVVLSGAPANGTTVTINLTPEVTKTTRTGGIRHDAIQVAISSSDLRVTNLGGGNLAVTFNDTNWDDPVVITVTAVDDGVVDGSDTQEFAPGPNTVSGILGPVVVEGAGGRGSLAINAPLMLPGELNRRASDGNVVAFTANPSPLPGAIETMLVETADLQAKLVALGYGNTEFEKLIGLTVEMSFGNGVDVILDPERPNEKFDRFWMITEIEDAGAGQKLLTLQNPSQLNVSLLVGTDIPNSASEYAITALSANFFVDERTQVDFMFVHDEDSPADSTGYLTPTRLYGLNMGPDLVIGGQLRSGGITYGDLEVIEINLGKGNNTFNVLGTHTREDGYQTWTLLNTGTEPVPYGGIQGDTVNVTLNATDITTATGNVIAAANPSVGNGFITTVTIGSAGTPANDSLVGQLITTDGQTRRVLGNIGNVLRVDLQWETLPTALSTYTLINPADGAFAVNLQGGDDTLIATGSTLGIIGFGGLGDDDMTGGEGDDILFGDRGRVDYYNESDAVVTRLGDSPEPITGFVTTQVTLATLSTLIDSGAVFPVPDDLADGLGTDDTGLRGLYVDINDGFGFLQPIRLIGNNTIDTLTLAEPFDADLQLPGPVVGDESTYRISTIPENQTDGVVRNPGLLITVDNNLGGEDVIHGGGGKDQILGGADDDEIHGEAGDDLILGDAGRIDRSVDPAAPTEPLAGDVVATLLDMARTIAYATGGDDEVHGGTGLDLLIGGTGADTMDGGDNEDIVVGDQTTADFTNGVLVSITTDDRSVGGVDTLYGGANDDILIGAANSDNLDGGTHRDLIFGDNVNLALNTGSGNAIDPRFRALTGTLLYAAGTGLAQVSGELAGNPVPGGRPAWSDWTMTLDPSQDPARFGNDYIAGGAGDDEIFGQLGNDTIQGDGSIASKMDADPGTLVVTAFRDGAGELVLQPSYEAVTDGDDYIEGNGGNDVIFGGLGQDDIIGGTSSLFSLNTAALRPDGADLIFGGAGTDAGRGDNGDLSATGHSRDSDMILGDNGNIFRLVGINGLNGGAYLSFNYDTYSSSKIIARADVALEYTPGGPDFTLATEAGPADIAINPETGIRDIGAGDEIHGESGDDFIYGLAGGDALFGDGQNDVLIGGYGADWISGGTGDDGILGDDGRLLISRNPLAEPLYGVAAIPTNQRNLEIVADNKIYQAIVNVTDALKYTADLSPNNLDPAVSQNLFFPPLFANDIIYGGWGNDSIHSGAGDDAILGGEAPTVGFTNNYNASGTQQNLTLIKSDFFHPVNPGNVLGYNPTTTTFGLYDANDPLRTILLDNTGALSKTGTGSEWLLNFVSEGPNDAYWVNGSYSAVPTDGDDHIFGDLGNDWIVGGTGRDTMWAGWGDDLLNADDVLATFTTTDTNPSYEDLAFGGGGRDVLYTNTNGDRAIDWLGEFNSYFTPYSLFGSVSINRLLPPSLPAFLYALSESQGADQTLGANNPADPRNGEPFGEIALVLQSDAQWNNQTGAPRDPQPGNTGGSPVDIKNKPGTTNNKLLYFTADSAATSFDAPELLTDAQLAAVTDAAKQFWVLELGANDTRLASLNSAKIEVGNLLDLSLGATIGSNWILIDSDAAGYGWSLDSGMPGMDLLTVVKHELGHLLGLDHDDDGLMGETLAPGSTTGSSSSSKSVFDYLQLAAGNRSLAATSLIDWARDTNARKLSWSSLSARDNRVGFPEVSIDASSDRDNGKSLFGSQKKRRADDLKDEVPAEALTEWHIEG